MQITEEMIEKAKAEFFKAGIVDVFSVRAALTAALSEQQAVEVNVLVKAYNAGFEASSSGFNYEYCDDSEQNNEFTAERAGAIRSIAAALVDVPVESARKFQTHDRLRKTKGSSWQGRVVGFYSTSLTPIGYCIESERERGSVQIYPEGALERVPEGS